MLHIFLNFYKVINSYEVYENINCNMGVMYNFVLNDLSGNIFYSSVLCKECNLPLIVMVIEVNDFSICIDILYGLLGSQTSTSWMKA